MNPRSQIEQIKAELAASLANNSPRFNRAVSRELMRLFAQTKNDNLSLDDFIAIIENKFQIPAAAKGAIILDLRQAQKQIGKVWQTYFSEQLPVNSNQLSERDITNLLALYQVDFSQIRTAAKDIIIDELRRTARAGSGIEVLRSRLLRRGLAAGEARTLANTGLAQFDNASMFEMAQQAGVKKFIYDGVLHPNSRLFCREHLGKKYTITQITKMNNGQGLPVLTSCGGYNCTHWWTPVVE